MKKKSAKVTQASPAIWRKFSAYEKKLWKELFDLNIWISRVISGLENTTRETIDVFAHNAAIEAIWLMQKEGLVKRVPPDARLFTYLKAKLKDLKDNNRTAKDIFNYLNNPTSMKKSVKKPTKPVKKGKKMAKKKC